MVWYIFILIDFINKQKDLFSNIRTNDNSYEMFLIGSLSISIDSIWLIYMRWVILNFRLAQEETN